MYIYIAYYEYFISSLAIKTGRSFIDIMWLWTWKSNEKDMCTEKNNLVIVNGCICFGWPNYMETIWLPLLKRLHSWQYQKSGLRNMHFTVNCIYNHNVWLNIVFDDFDRPCLPSKVLNGCKNNNMNKILKVYLKIDLYKKTHLRPAQRPIHGRRVRMRMTRGVLLAVVSYWLYRLCYQGVSVYFKF